MKYSTKNAIIIYPLVFLMALIVILSAEARPLPVIDVEIVTKSGQTHQFTTEVANNYEDRATGLMNRKELPQNSAMLFIFENEEFINMWMKNTYIPLDILFIDKEGGIVNIIENTKPLSLDRLSSIAPVKYALEVNAGTVKNLSINSDDTVLFEYEDKQE